MLLTFLVLFTVIPMVEIYLLMGMARTIGPLLTLLIALGTGVLGATLARQQGMATLAKLSRQMSSGQPPADTLVDGAMILLAGAVLITPGVLTDAFGFALLIPPIRNGLKPLLRAMFRNQVRRQASSGSTSAYVWSTSPSPESESRGRVIEAEVLEVRTRDAES